MQIMTQDATDFFHLSLLFELCHIQLPSTKRFLLCHEMTLIYSICGSWQDRHAELTGAEIYRFQTPFPACPSTKTKTAGPGGARTFQSI